MTGAQWAALLTGVAGAGASVYGATRTNRTNREIAGAELDQDENQDVRDVALRESALDPFRHQRSQFQNLTGLDMLKQLGQGGRRVTPPANVAPYAGSVRTGYRASPGMLESIEALEQSIRGGNTAPTMTDPNNFGRTSAVNINAARPGAGAGGAGVALPFAGAPRREAEGYIPDQAQLRNEGAGGVVGGAMKGAAMGSVGGLYGAAAGFVGGAIGGAFSKNAKTAATDLTVEQASKALNEVYREWLGRDASPAEIQSQLEGQGLKPGHRWVGKDNLLDVIRQIQNSVESRQRAA